MTGLGRSLLALVGALGLTGCPSAQPSAPKPQGPPQRIVSQTILSDEVLWALGPAVQSRVVAVSILADDAAYSTVANQWPPTVRRAPLTSEALLASEPDLVIVADFTAIETREMLQRAAVPTLTLIGFSGFADWRHNTQAIADAVGHADGGRALVARFDHELATRAAVAPADPNAPTVVSWTAGNVAGSGTTFDDVARAAGLRNLAAEQGIAGHKPVSVEQLVAWDPQMLVVACEGTADTACADAAAEVAARPGIAATRAARTAGIVALPTRILYSSGFSMLEVVTALRERVPAGVQAP